MTHNELIELRDRLSKGQPVIAMNIGGHRSIAAVIGTRGHEMHVKVWVSSVRRWAKKPVWHPLSAYVEDANVVELQAVTTTPATGEQLRMTG